MKYENKAIVVGNKRYIIIESVSYDKKDYVYLLNSEDMLDSKFCEIEGMKLFEIEPKLFAEKIFPLFIEKFSE